MKRQFPLYACLILVCFLVICCNDNSSVQDENDVTDTAITVTDSPASVEEPTRNNEKDTSVTIGNLEIMKRDLEPLHWEAARNACSDLGNGWRLPTKDELRILYDNRKKIGGFQNEGYWSSTEADDDIMAHFLNFFTGNDGPYAKESRYRVRAVRLKQ